MLFWPCETSCSKGISLPRPIPYDLQTRMPFCSNWILCSLLKPSILFTSKDFLVSLTAQTHGDVPFTGRSESVHVCRIVGCMFSSGIISDHIHTCHIVALKNRSDKQLFLLAGRGLLLQQSASCYGCSLLRPTADRSLWHTPSET